MDSYAVEGEGHPPALDGLPPVPFTFFSTLNTEYQPSTADFQFQPSILPGPCSRCSGLATFDSSNQATKRRRIDQSEPTTQAFEPVHTGNEWSLNTSVVEETESNFLEVPTTQICRPNMVPSVPMKSPLTRRILEWSSFFCPCCGQNQSEGYQLVNNTQEALYPSTEPYSTEKIPEFSAAQQVVPIYNECNLHENAQHQGQTYSTQYHAFPTTAAAPVASQFTQPVPLFSEVNQLYTQEWQQKRLSENSTIGSGSLTDSLTLSPQSHASIMANFNAPPQQLSNGAPSQTSTISGNTEGVELEIPGPEATMSEWRTIPSNNSGYGMDMVILPGPRSGKRGPFKDLALREQTAQTRKIGSCVRCRMQRIRCENNADDPEGICLTCKKVTPSKAARFPCLRYKITDITLYKPGQVPGFEWTSRWSHNLGEPIQKWASTEVRIIRVSEGYSSKGVDLRVRKFVPIEGDKLERSWVYNGLKRSVQVPAYAVVDLAQAKASYTKYIKESMEETIHSVVRNANPLLHQVYTQAWNEALDESNSKEMLEVLQLALRLWTSIRVTTKSSFIIGEDTLDMPLDILDSTSPTPGKVPLPPVMGAQLEMVLIQQIQANLRRELLDKFQRFILRNKNINWFATFLVTVILLHNTALIIAHDASYALKHGIKRRFAREQKVKEYHLGANILLAHFHYCNKGRQPFSKDCSEHTLRKLGDLTEEKVKAVKAIRDYAVVHREEWASIRKMGQYENELFYVSQVFEENWEPTPISV